MLTFYKIFISGLQDPQLRSLMRKPTVCAVLRGGVASPRPMADKYLVNRILSDIIGYEIGYLAMITDPKIKLDQNLVKLIAEIDELASVSH